MLVVAASVRAYAVSRAPCGERRRLAAGTPAGYENALDSVAARRTCGMLAGDVFHARHAPAEEMVKIFRYLFILAGCPAPALLNGDAQVPTDTGERWLASAPTCSQPSRCGRRGTLGGKEMVERQNGREMPASPERCYGATANAIRR